MKSGTDIHDSVRMIWFSIRSKFQCVQYVITSYLPVLYVAQDGCSNMSCNSVNRYWSSVFFSLICISGARLGLAAFVRGRTADCYRTRYTRSVINNDVVYHLYFIMSAQFFLSVHATTKKAQLRWFSGLDNVMITTWHIPFWICLWSTFFRFSTKAIYHFTVTQTNQCPAA